MKTILKNLPSMQELLAEGQVQQIKEQHHIPEKKAKEWMNETLDQFRKQIISDPDSYKHYTKEAFLKEVVSAAAIKMTSESKYRLRPVINGTGTVLHTNLGRARLSDHAVQHVVNTAQQYSTLEYDLTTGERGSRHSIIEELLKKATGAEAAIAVNNNAAAVYFILRALAQDSEVVVSRGELIEIGGSFRVSTIMSESGARLTEVGTTNKTHLKDYKDVLHDGTKMIMKVHTSNFAPVGFTADVTVPELRTFLDDQRLQEDILLYEDLGSGSLFPFAEEEIGNEPIVEQSLAAGADLVSFSGDKLLGGPQAGIIAGKKEVIDQLKTHPLARVLRLDKMTLAALEATLFDYIYDDEARNQIPALRDIRASAETIYHRATTLAERINEKGDHFHASVRQDTSKVGGGTMPLVELPTYGVFLAKDGWRPNQIERYCRALNPPLIVRVKNDGVFIDCRTLDEENADTAAEILTGG
ncbi:L-seryl-tRNA(Sec) selenium transferase [Salisediminibacterium halotolerans]|uniref:L-seryl-tRNA(Sec) selenium transferase n=1 Tax=Salisediminibacterium halotolerans TaxID=517425 RepID=A0A1H9RWW0_9BACI|nr:L-seryl-tRNA(Sec) selenium transferase [Salisediminibacterium haloalkalitolerans]SER77098.1 L-seryl-tRNA(Ser) seleniumtransferase [Salisediminibacterium haloalkalitolerans]